MNKKLYIIAFAALSLGTACKKESQKQPGQIAKAEWLIGNWENRTQNGDLSESWAKVNDSTFEGTSFFIKGKDTLHNESVVLSQKGGELLYSPTVKGQNGDLPVAFKMTAATAKTIVFENPAHDFPQKISYQMITKDSIVAQISGIQGGKPASESYPMGRKK